MRLRQLEVFRAVMAHGTVTAAAQALQMSQPAATSAIRAFERSIGLALFDRLNGRLRPTPEARSLYDEVDRLFRNVAVVERYAHDLKEAQSGVLTIASTHSLSCDVLAEVIARFRDEHPHVQIWLQVTTTREIIDQALKRQIDFGVIYAPTDEQGLRIERMMARELVCVLRPDHPLATRRTLRPQDLRDATLIVNVRNDPILTMIEQAFRPIDIRRHARIGTNNSSTACALVHAGGGIAIVEPFAIGLLFPDLAVRPFRPRIAIETRVVSNAEHPMSRLATRFVQRLRGAMRGSTAAKPDLG